MKDSDLLLWIGVILAILAVLLLLYTYQVGYSAVSTPSLTYCSNLPSVKAR